MNKCLFTIACLVWIPNTLAHSGHIHDEAIEICQQKQTGDACSYLVGDKKRFTGSCQSFNAVLMCVRNQPIEYLSTQVPNTQPKETKSERH